jgi:hypothetical protein
MDMSYLTTDRRDPPRIAWSVLKEGVRKVRGKCKVRLSQSTPLFVRSEVRSFGGNIPLYETLQFG